MGRKFRMYVVEVSNDGSEFELVFEIDGKVVDRKTGYCIEDCLYYSHDFFWNNCENNKFNGMKDTLEVDLKFRM